MITSVNQKTSPIKFCFLIKSNSLKRFERAVQTSFSLWGGLTSPILSLYKNMPKNYREEYEILIGTKAFYNNTIENYDPDVIIYDEDLDKIYIKSLIGDRKLITTEQVIEGIKQNRDTFGLNIIKIFESLLLSEFKFQRNDNLKFFLPSINNNSLFLKLLIGAPLEPIKDLMTKYLDGKKYSERPSLNYTNLKNFLPNENLGFLELNVYKINSYPEKQWYKGEAIYFLKKNRLNDLINFWNLRALGWNIIAIPISEIKNDYFQDRIKRFLASQNYQSQGLQIITYLNSVDLSHEEKENSFKILENIAEDLGQKGMKFAHQRWFPRFWEERSILEADKAICENYQVDYSYESVEYNEDFIQFKAKPLPFKFRKNSNSRFYYKSNLSFNYFDEYANKAGLVYGIDSMDWIRLTHSFGSDKWKLSKNGLSYFVHDADHNIGFQIPKALEFFKLYFAKRNSNLKQTANGQLANQVLKNIGGIRGSYFLKDLNSLKILDLFENGNIISYVEILGKIKQYLNIKTNEDSQYYLKQLISNRIIEFGAKIQCSVCNQRTFYLPNQLKVELPCSICRNNFDLPTNNPKEITWSYRGIGPFSRNNKVGGLMCVFLTLRLFSQEFARISGNMSSLIGFELERKNTNLKEVDLAALLEERFDVSIPPDLFLCECKTFKDFNSKDAERMIELGEEFPNSILTFATLKEKLSESEKKEIKKVVLHFQKGVGNRPINPVLILTSKELLPDDMFDHFSDYEDITKPFHKFNDWIGNLAEFSIEKHLEMKTWGEIRTDIWKKAMEQREQKQTTIMVKHK